MVSRVISNSGEIRREYQLAQQEIQRQREAEIAASEALIKKIQAEERHLQRLEERDKSLAKSLAKKENGYKKESAQTQRQQHQANAPVKENPGNSSGSNKPSCSSSIYGSQSKEELCVPGDVVGGKHKTLDVEVRTRIDSADVESDTASIDSINQEIHHFKPIKVAPRTPLQSALKLIRVIPVVKKAGNVLPQSPNGPRIVVGCSWSAFRGTKTKKRAMAHCHSLLLL